MAIDTDDKALAWLRRYGYVHTDSPSRTEIAAGVHKMQRVYGFQPDGNLSAQVKRAMSLFRCSHKDANIVMADTLAATDNSAAAVAGTVCKWKKNTITFSIDNQLTLGSDRDTSLSIIRQGFQMYESLTGLTFTETTNYNGADIQIVSGPAAMLGDTSGGNILAISTTPCGAVDKQLRTIFDSGEPWNLGNSGAGVILNAVWLHELGHLVGLNHSSSAADLMAPYYNPAIVYPQSNDKRRLAALYGIPFVDTPQGPPTLNVGAYAIDGVLIVRHDGGVAINLRDVVAK